MLSTSDKVWIKVKSAFLRITQSKTTFAFFLFSFIHCFAQGIIQSYLFTVDTSTSHSVHQITAAANVTMSEFAWMTRDNSSSFQLRLCFDIPYNSGGEDVCPRTIVQTQYTTSLDTRVPPGFDMTSGVRSVAPGESGSPNVSVYVRGREEPVKLTPSCAETLLYPDRLFRNMRRESLTLIAIQFWLFAISFIALMFDSVPHTVSVLCARVLLTGYSAYSIWRSKDIELRLAAIIASEGTPCGMNMFPHYFATRLALEIPDLVLNLSALLISAFLSTSLLKTYNASTFKRVGPPAHIVRIYRFFLATLVNMHLALFFTIGALALWTDELFNSSLYSMTKIIPLFMALVITAIILMFPMLFLGWLALHRERKRWMSAYLIIAFVIVTGWGIQFYSRIYRWTFVQWPFMACMTTAALMLLVGSILFGIISWANFDKGLSHYLYVEDALTSTDFEHDSFETSKKFYDAERGSVYAEEKRRGSEASITLALPVLGSGKDSNTMYSSDGRAMKDFDFVDLDLKMPETVYRSGV